MYFQKLIKYYTTKQLKQKHLLGSYIEYSL